MLPSPCCAATRCSLWAHLGLRHIKVRWVWQLNSYTHFLDYIRDQALENLCCGRVSWSDTAPREGLICRRIQGWRHSVATAAFAPWIARGQWQHWLRGAWWDWDVDMIASQPNWSGNGRLRESTKGLCLDRARRTRMESVEWRWI